MQFIKNGPDIPERLLQAHEDKGGRVVFFCGAGISYPARLPGFKGLVSKLYAGLGEAPSSVEQAAIKNGQYDTAIGLLEDRIVDGRTIVREQLARILTPDLSVPQATATHDALLTLARNREGRFRLITTNFDRLFEDVINGRKLSVPVYQAPLLPVPKNRLDGLVYLHGLLPTPPSTELNHLIISSGDFGRAYLTERWAARFLSELFRNYTVCFVGYSINDPVLRYMMDALAADRLLGEAHIQHFAFGSYSKGKEKEEANEWKAKNVIPILYREHRNHAYLHQTLHAWASAYRDGVLGKERIVSQYAIGKPLINTEQDDFVGRVLWALSDLSGLPTKRFAELDPVPPIEWLEPLTDTRFGHSDLASFRVQPATKEDKTLAFSLIFRPTPYAKAAWMTLVHRSHASANQWDEVMHQLARWLTRHLDNPKLILWVAKQGGVLHSEFASLVSKALKEQPPSAPMQTLWQLARSHRLQDHSARSGLYDWLTQLNRHGFTPTLRLQLRDLLTPRVRLSEPFRWSEGDEEEPATEPQQVRDLVNWEIVLSTNNVHLGLEKLDLEDLWRTALPGLLTDATTLLRDALDLMRELGGIDDRRDRSYIHRPSIGDHPQNRDSLDWTALIDLTRDAWRATAAKHPEQARLEIERWLVIPYPLFRRLVFFAATSGLFTPAQAIGWLLADDHWWLWSEETRREALRLLVAVAPQLDHHGSEILEQAILRGPPPAIFPDDIEPEGLQRRFDREIWLRLAKYRVAGAQLGSDAAAMLDKLARQYPTWQLADDERDEFPTWMGSGDEWRTFLTTPKRCRDLVDWLREYPKCDMWREDEWRERCKRDFRRTVCALLYLARQGEWFPDRWSEALQAWGNETLAKRSWRYVGGVLTGAPKDVVKELARAMSWWLLSIAKVFSGNEEAFFTLIRQVLALHSNEAIEATNDSVSEAINHPVGHVTDAALSWWYRQELEDGQGLTGTLKPIFSDLCDTTGASFRHGRVLLATHLVALFRVDEEWTKQHVIPLFRWELSVDEARAAWQGFLRSPRVYPPLIEAIRAQFLVTALHYADLDSHGDQYADFLTFVALEPGDMFSRKELASATRSLPADGLRSATESLVRALEGAGKQRAEYWLNRIKPYLKFIWPKSVDLIRPAISESFARLCIGAGDAFPDALHELKPWLRPLDHPNLVVHLLNEAKLCESFLEEALTFLDAIIEDDGQQPPTLLKNCLDVIGVKRSDLENDIRFLKLSQYLRKYQP